MACLNETFAFSQPHFATSVGASFGYADVTVSAAGGSRDRSPHLAQPPPSPSPRFQPSPQPFLKNPVPPSTLSPTQGAPDSKTSSSGLLQSLRGGQSPSSEEQQRPVTESPDCQDSPPVVHEVHPDSAHSSLEAAVSSASEGDPPPHLKGSGAEEAVEKEEKENEEREEGREKEKEGRSGKGGGGEESPEEQAKVQASGSGAPPHQKRVLAVRKKSPVGEGVQREDCPGVSSLGTSMGDSKENKSPRSSTSENLQVLSLKDHYDVERELGRGTYGKVVLAKCRHTGTQVALKLLPKTSTKMRDFQREFQLSYFLSPHGSIIDTYNVAFQTKSSFVFAQEHAALGDLFDAIPPQVGMREADAKAVIKQLASALEFMHSKHLVHRDIKPENVLVMAVDFSRVKLMDFGMTRKHGTMVRKTNGSIPYTPPEVCEAVRNENILVSASADVWALAVLLFCMLTGNFPWENADIGDMYFKEFVLWQRRKTTKLPSQWRRFSPRAMKYFRKALDIKPERRCDVEEIHKYLTDVWTQKPRTNDSEEDSGSSASCDHMDELATMLKDHGIETRVDRRLRERRISEWLLSL